MERMREAGRRASRVLQTLAPMVKVDVSLDELDSMAEKLTYDEGCVPAFKGYMGYRHTLCASVNEEVVHGIPSPRKLKRGDILGIDYGLVYDGYYADSAVTIPVGDIPERLETLLKVTMDSLYAGIQAAKVGNSVQDVSRAIQNAIVPYGFGIVRDFVGHGIGTSLHEPPQVPNYVDAAPTTPLTHGMAIAIEPMVTLGSSRVKVLPDGWTVVTQDGSMAAHYEHTILILESGPEVLTEWDGEAYRHVLRRGKI